MSGSVREFDGVGRRVGRNDDTHADPEVEDRLHLVVGDIAGALHLAENLGLTPARSRDACIRIRRENAIEVADESTTGDVRERVHRDTPTNRRERGRVDHTRPQEFVGERRLRAGPRWFIERATRTLQQCPTRERVPVAPQTWTRDADDGVADRDVLRQYVVPFGRTDDETDEVELARRHELRVLGHFAAEERSPGLATTRGDSAHDGRGNVRLETTHREVVEEEQWISALGRDVIGRTDEVDPDRVVPARRPRDHRLRADAVGRGDQHRVRVVEGTEVEQSAEPADSSEHTRARCRSRVVFDQFDRMLTGRDVDAGIGVGHRLLGHGYDDERSTSGASSTRLASSTSRSTDTG